MIQFLEKLDKHPVKSIIIYTFGVAAATWAISTFILDERKINFYRAETDNITTIAETYKAKVAVLEDENAKIRSEKDKYLSWLMSEPKSLPALEKRISDLEKERKQLQQEAKNAGNSIASVFDESLAVKRVGTYVFSRELKLGETFVDPKTNVTLGISAIHSNYTADVYLYLPSQKGQEISAVKPGMTWQIDSAGKSYRLTVDKISWLTDSAEVSIAELHSVK